MTYVRDVDEIWAETEAILDHMERPDLDLSWEELTAYVERLDELAVEYDRSLRLELERMGRAPSDPWAARRGDPEHTC